MTCWPPCSTTPPSSTGDIGVDYLDTRPDLRDARLSDEVRYRHAAAAGFALLHDRSARSLVPVPGGRMAQRRRGAACRRAHRWGGHARGPGAGARRSGPRAARRRVDGDEVGDGRRDRDGAVDLIADGLRRRYRVRLSAHAADVNGPEGQSSFARRSEDDTGRSGRPAGECRAPLPGAIAKVLVELGDRSSDGDGLVVLEAMKMEHTLRAGGTGTVGEVACAVGQQVDVGDLLIAVTPQ